MSKDVILGIIIPFVGTSLGAACVFLLKKELSVNLKKAFSGFAGGVMVAASIWSLLIPSIDQASNLGVLSFVPAIVGFWLGILFLLLIDNVVPHLHIEGNKEEGLKLNKKLSKTTMMLLAITIHNIPEGMAVGVIYAGYLNGSNAISLSGALALAIGIAIQNFPEGAIVSLPLSANGKNKKKSFILGCLSGIVESIAAVLTIFLSKLVIPFMPYLLSFAAGAMMYVVVEELIPEMAEGEHSHVGVICFSLGFSVMMLLDLLLG